MSNSPGTNSESHRRFSGPAVHLRCGHRFCELLRFDHEQANVDMIATQVHFANRVNRTTRIARSRRRSGLLLDFTTFRRFPHGFRGRGGIVAFFGTFLPMALLLDGRRFIFLFLAEALRGLRPDSFAPDGMVHFSLAWVTSPFRRVFSKRTWLLLFFRPRFSTVLVAFFCLGGQTITIKSTLVLPVQRPPLRVCASPSVCSRVLGLGLGQIGTPGARLDCSPPSISIGSHRHRRHRIEPHGRQIF